MGISEGTLPVKYLGVPLISSRLTKADCSVLKDKVLSRIHSWDSKILVLLGKGSTDPISIIQHPNLLEFYIYFASKSDSRD